MLAATPDQSVEGESVLTTAQLVSLCWIETVHHPHPQSQAPPTTRADLRRISAVASFGNTGAVCADQQLPVLGGTVDATSD
jgi:hypothetical protein